MHSCFKLLILFFISSIFSNSLAQNNVNENFPLLIPYPQKVVVNSGHFTLNNQTHIIINGNSDSIKKIAGVFITKLKSSRSIDYKIGYKNKPTVNSIFFDLELSDTTIHNEGYLINVNKEFVIIKAKSEAGLFYGLQTFLQLLPKEIESHTVAKDLVWQIPCVEIYDEPRFQWRGIHLDVSRHFMPVSFIKKYLDNMALHKLNTFHWHLTDDQGWRIEIKKYPKLTQVGAWRKETLVGHQYVRPQQFDSTPYVGYYTQEEIKEIVKYAAERYITIIPEIDMPGHATAAIAAYPQFGVNKDSIKVATRWGVFPNLYNVNDSTFHFLEDVLTEVMELFPSRYIHVGGDEVRVEQWEKSLVVQSKIKELSLKNENELQSYFIKRIEKFINSKGREIIGWDEILECGLAPNALVMSWRGEEGSILAANLGHKVIMAPVSNLYFDFYQGPSNDEPLAIGGYTSLRKVYSYNPIPRQLRGTKESNFVIGAQANVWSEYLKDEQDAEYMVFPRIAALSEIVWTNEKNKNWERFSNSIPGLLERYKLRDIHYSNSVFNVAIVPLYDSTTYSMKVSLSNELGLKQIRYTLDGSEVLASSALYQNPLSITKKTFVRAKLFQSDNFIGRECQQMLNCHIGFGKKVKYALPYDTSVFITNNWTLVDGIVGGDNNMYSNIWQRFKSDVDITIDLLNKKRVKALKSSFIQIPDYAYTLPSSFEILVSKDGKYFKSVPITIESVTSPSNTSIVHYSIKLKKASAINFIRFVAKNPMNKLNESTGKIVPAVLMVDEVVVE